MSSKRSILVTGIPGAGKSTLSDYLQRLNFESYDLEEVPGLFKKNIKSYR